MDTPLRASPLLCSQAATGSVIAGARWSVRPLGPFRVRPWRGLGVMDPEHEAQVELVEIGGRQYPIHPAAVFPIMSGREFDELVEDMRVNGLDEPVVVSSDRLIDGRNRVRAC